MSDFHHISQSSDEAASPRRTRLGLVLFAVYLALYVGFVLLNALAPDRMSWTPLFGINVAVLFGLGLIFAAFLLALVYEILCRRMERSDAQRPGDAP